jgi:hypothetical protein
MSNNAEGVGFDAGKAVRRKVREDTLIGALNRNTDAQRILGDIVEHQNLDLQKRLELHEKEMARLRELQFSDVDRQLESLAQSRKEMALGRKALNQNTVAMNEHAAVIKELVLALQSYEEKRRRG